MKMIPLLICIKQVYIGSYIVAYIVIEVSDNQKAIIPPKPRDIRSQNYKSSQERLHAMSCLILGLVFVLFLKKSI
jgi:hypothetical protein